MLTIADHPLLDLRAFITEFPTELGEMESKQQLRALLLLPAAAPLENSDSIRTAVRDLLRFDGFKPSGRNKPASEYLIKAADQNKLNSINVAVDACNAVSLHSGLPISVIDLDRAREPLRISIAEQSTSYVFNPSGQSIDISGLLCLIDADGPCANAVKDSQRTKTGDRTRRTLSVIWGTRKLPGRSEVAEKWYRDLLHGHNATTRTCPAT